MRIYRIRRPETAKYEIQGGRKWHLPGIRCELCDSTWANVGLDYPLVDLSGFDSESLYRSDRTGVVTAREYRALRDALLAWRPAVPTLKPGTGFGALLGSASG